MKFGTIEATTISSEEDIDLSVLDFSETKRHPRGTSRIGATATKKPRRVTEPEEDQQLALSCPDSSGPGNGRRHQPRGSPPPPCRRD